MRHLPWDHYLGRENAPETISDYIKKFDCKCPMVVIDCRCTRRRLDALFGGIYGFLEEIRVGNGIFQPIPELRITHSDEFEIEARSCMYMSTGAINHCLSTEGTPQFPVLGFELPSNIFNRELLGKTAIRWMLAHEYHHVMFHPDHVWTDNLTAHALETDADMCATAIIYRAFQKIYSKVIQDDLDFRCLVFYCIFSVLRPLTKFTQSDTHPSLAMRFWFIRNKLSGLRKNQEHRPDVAAITSETRAANQRLLDCLIKCETEYQKFNPQSSKKLLEEIHAIITDESYSQISQRWDGIHAKIRPPLFDIYWVPME